VIDRITIFTGTVTHARDRERLL